MVLDAVVENVELLLQDPETGFLLRPQAGEIRRRSRIQGTFKFQPALAQAQALKFVVDGPDIHLLDAANLFPHGHRIGNQRLQCLPGGFRTIGRHRHRRRIEAADAAQVAVEIPPLQTFDHHHIRRQATFTELLVDQPGKIGAQKIAVALLEQGAPKIGAGALHFNASFPQLDTGHLHFFHDLAQQLPRLIMVADRDRQHICRPEVAETAYRQQQQQAHHRDHAHTHGGGIEPDQRLATAYPGLDPRGALAVQILFIDHFHHRDPYLIRSRCRTSSAMVLTTKVNMNSTNAARNSTR